MNLQRIHITVIGSPLYLLQKIVIIKVFICSAKHKLDENLSDMASHAELRTGRQRTASTPEEDADVGNHGDKERPAERMMRTLPMVSLNYSYCFLLRIDLNNGDLRTTPHQITTAQTIAYQDHYFYRE